MDTLLDAISARLTREDEKQLKEIHAPRVVAIPPSNAWMNLCVTADGEIRCYGAIEKKSFDDPGRRVYIASRDGGLSWKQHDVADYTTLCSAYRSPASGVYVTLTALGEYLESTIPTPPEGANGLYALLSDEGPGGAARWVKASELPLVNPRMPMALRSRKRLIATAALRKDATQYPAVVYSDDEGEHWRTVLLDTVPKHTAVWPHEGIRWQNGACEATIAERADGSLLMLARTSQDYHYQYESFDGGEHWTRPRPSCFHGTLTMPTLLRLSDGRMLCFWCNTQPLPESDHSKVWPPLTEGERNGEGGEDVFTNRDANHAAISEDDGVTWRGFREMFLNPLRNDADFRTEGSNDDCNDKSVHQFQAIELPFGKVMLAYGQHPLARRIVILDPDWLYETKREEDWQHGMGDVSAQVYLKSVSGNKRPGLSGHCAWNRTHGAVLVPSPDGDYSEALQLARVDDPRLYSPVQGCVWNFPAARAGVVTVTLRVRGSGVRLSLTDRWINPIDTTARDFSQVSFDATDACVPKDEWTRVRVAWTEDGYAVYVGAARVAQGKLALPMPYGLCYLHMQSLADAPDALGTLIRRMEKE